MFKKQESLEPKQYFPMSFVTESKHLKNRVLSFFDHFQDTVNGFSYYIFKFYCFSCFKCQLRPLSHTHTHTHALKQIHTYRPKEIYAFKGK